MNLKHEIRAKISSVPTLPEVVLKLRECCCDPDVDYGDMARIIETDAALTSNILRLANSVYFGCEKTISSVKFAMTRLGLKRIHQMALAISAAPLACKPVDGYVLSPQQLWNHSLATAIAAERLAQEVDDVEPSDAFTAGILHDLGKTILGIFVQNEITDIKNLITDDNRSFDEAERSVLGTDHAAVGGMILRHWHLPEHITDAVSWHHRPTRGDEVQPLTDVIHIADILCMHVGWGQGQDGLRYRQDSEAAARLKVTDELGDHLINEVEVGLEELKRLIDLPEEILTS